MININAFKKSFEDLANPAQTGDSFSPDQFNRELPVVVISAIRRHLGLPEDYSPGMPQPRISYEATQMIANELLDLRTPYQLNVSKDGVAELPADYFYLSSLNYKYAKKQDTYKKMSFDTCCETEEGTKDDKPLNYGWQDTPITLLSDAEFNMAIGSSLRKPTASKPIARLYGKTSNDIYQIQFAPNIDLVNIIYVRKPKVPVWGYTINPLTLLEQYNSATSQDIEVPESMFDTLRFMMLKRLGVPEREIELYKYGQDLQNKGV